MTGDAIPWKDLYTTDDTVICFRLNAQQTTEVKIMVEQHDLKTCITDCFTDLLAIPSLCVIADPDRITKEEAGTLLSFLEEVEDDFFVIFSRPPTTPIPSKLKHRLTVLNDIRTNLSILELKIVQYKKRSVKKRNLDKRYDLGVLTGQRPGKQLVKASSGYVHTKE